MKAKSSALQLFIQPENQFIILQHVSAVNINKNNTNNNKEGTIGTEDNLNSSTECTDTEHIWVFESCSDMSTFLPLSKWYDYFFFPMAKVWNDEK